MHRTCYWYQQHAASYGMQLWQFCCRCKVLKTWRSRRTAGTCELRFVNSRFVNKVRYCMILLFLACIKERQNSDTSNCVQHHAFLVSQHSISSTVPTGTRLFGLTHQSHEPDAHSRSWFLVPFSLRSSFSGLRSLGRRSLLCRRWVTWGEFSFLSPMQSHHYFARHWIERLRESAKDGYQIRAFNELLGKDWCISWFSCSSLFIHPGRFNRNAHP